MWAANYDNGEVAELTNIKQPYLIFRGDAQDQVSMKTALGIRDRRPDACVGEWVLPEAVWPAPYCRFGSFVLTTSTLMSGASL
jgi:hypothetical protein